VVVAADADGRDLWEGTVAPFFQARAEQRINAFLRTLWHEVTLERLRNPSE
jgi:hypothetical protein